MKNKAILIQKINVRNIFAVFNESKYPVFEFEFVNYVIKESDMVSLQFN
ncbi:hypothetical protein [Mycoplasma hafezii]